MTDKPAWWLCEKSKDPRFTAGAAYEVFRYDERGRAIIITNGKSSAALPVHGVTFVPHDPWAAYRKQVQP